VDNTSLRYSIVKGRLRRHDFLLAKTDELPFALKIEDGECEQRLSLGRVRDCRRAGPPDAIRILLAGGGPFLRLSEANALSLLACAERFDSRVTFMRGACRDGLVSVVKGFIERQRLAWEAEIGAFEGWMLPELSEAGYFVVGVRRGSRLESGDMFVKIGKRDDRVSPRRLGTFAYCMATDRVKFAKSSDGRILSLSVDLLRLPTDAPAEQMFSARGIESLRRELARALLCR
jgi:hypothetical protein